jgi:hypothetical protein
MSAAPADTIKYDFFQLKLDSLLLELTCSVCKMLNAFLEESKTFVTHYFLPLFCSKIYDDTAASTGAGLTSHLGSS